MKCNYFPHHICDDDFMEGGCNYKDFYKYFVKKKKLEQGYLMQFSVKT